MARFPFGGEGDPLLRMLPPHVEPIAVNTVVGSVDRYRQLDRRFRIGKRLTARLRGIIQAMEDGAHFPPIEVYRLDGACYVLDGHHRVAAALQVGQLYLDAVVTECLPRVDSANPLQAARIDFGLRTGLRTVAFSSPARYGQALRQIQEHRWYLNERGRRASLREAAEDWRQQIFAPVARQLTAAHLLQSGGTVEEGDLYLQVSDLKYGVSRERGHDIGFAAAIREWANRHRQPDRLGFLGRWADMGMMVLN
ncbi:MAG: DUF4032 domain-containing protein [Chloroflexota bacterium]